MARTDWDMKLRELIPTYLAHLKVTVSPITYTNYHQRILDLDRYWSLHAPPKSWSFHDHPTVDDWVQDMARRKLSPRTIALYYTAAHDMFEWAVKAQLIEENPAPKRKFVVPIPKRHAFTAEEVGWVCDIMPRCWAVATRLAFYSGLRLADIAQLEWSAWDGQNLTITPQKTRKYGKTVTIPLTDDLSQDIHEIYMEVNASAFSDGHIFPPLATLYAIDRHKTLSSTFIRYSKRAGVGKSFHCLRHGCVTRMVNKGVSPMVIASITGHSLGQIMAYAHPSMEVKKEALQ